MRDPSVKYRRDGTPYPPGDAGLFEWAEDMGRSDLRIVKQDILPNGFWVSTVWLGLDHNFFRTGPPLIFETMCENVIGEWEDFQERYSTENDAIVGHLEALDQFRARWSVEAVPHETLESRRTSPFAFMRREAEIMPIGCKICIARDGLKGSEIDKLPKTHDELYEHLEAVHHMVVLREGETEAQAQTRFIAAHPAALDCDDCRERHAPWAAPKPKETT